MNPMSQLAALLGLGLASAAATPYRPGKHSPRRHFRHATVKPKHNPVGTKAEIKGISNIPRGYVIGSGRAAERSAIGVNGIRGAKGAGR